MLLNPIQFNFFLAPESKRVTEVFLSLFPSFPIKFDGENFFFTSSFSPSSSFFLLSLPLLLSFFFLSLFFLYDFLMESKIKRKVMVMTYSSLSRLKQSFATLSLLSFSLSLSFLTDTKREREKKKEREGKRNSLKM